MYTINGRIVNDIRTRFYSTNTPSYERRCLKSPYEDDRETVVDYGGDRYRYFTDIPYPAMDDDGDTSVGFGGLPLMHAPHADDEDKL